MSEKTRNRMSTFAATVGGAAFLASTAASAGALFQSTDLGNGYETGSAPIHLAEGKCGEGKCGEGKCGESMDKDAEGKCGEGKCGGESKDAEGKCGEGKCGS
ncbi:MAG: low-complexity protein [Proteobacteria bacterium]|nr:low-complexity protein [Pseudomonadota bacterium]